MENYMNIKDKFDEIINLIENSHNYQKYLELKKEMLGNEQINKLINEIKAIQKELVKKEYNHQDFSYEEKEINKRLDILNNIPLYVEYNKYQSLVNEELILIKDKINNYIDNI